MRHIPFRGSIFSFNVRFLAEKHFGFSDTFDPYQFDSTCRKVPAGESFVAHHRVLFAGKRVGNRISD
jgi:hypothetical protein